MNLSFPHNRRRKERINYALPVAVRAISVRGERIKTATILENVSSSGLFMHLSYQLPLGGSLFALIRLPNAVRLAAIGRVVRTEYNTSLGMTGTAVCFTQTRLLELAA